jgi:hypothetical protein
MESETLTINYTEPVDLAAVDAALAKIEDGIRELRAVVANEAKQRESPTPS